VTNPTILGVTCAASDDRRVTATHHDYDWINTWGNRVFRDAYCFTLISDMTPAQLLDRLAVEHKATVVGAENTIEPAYAAWDVHDGDGCYVAATTVDHWTLMFEPNGYIGVTPEIVVPLSRAARLVSHFRNVNAVDHFYCYEDGDLRLHFEPLFAASRDGTDADTLGPVLADVGFDLRDTPERTIANHTEAAFALAERLTGVQVTASLLSTSEFLCGIAALPSRSL
jgi:hypothetical protein